ncbi:MAG: murein biosynthesis integral membrane protein MurJ [Lachnospiraceae bacterium]|nr:murein biosynthesis integral membrane protein MurJ [Lachnospiraceae bacterium]
MEKNSKKWLLGSAVTLFCLSLLNKGLGFIKSMVIASAFGATLQTDAYYVADGLLQNMLIPISEAVAVSFLPFYIGIKEISQEDSKAFASRTITDIFAVAFGLSICLYVAAPLFLRILLPTYTAEEVRLSTTYFRILVWGMCLYMSNHLLQSLLNAEKEYGYSSFAAMLNNMILAAVVFFLGKRYGLKAMAGAVLFSYVVQYLFLQMKSRRYGRLTFRYGFRDRRILKLFGQAFPIFFGNAIYELNSLVDRTLLSAMNAGAVTAVSYAAVLYQFASNLIGIPLTTIIYTELAESFAEGRMEEGGAKLEKGLHIGLLFGIPITLFVMISAELIVQITYGRGAFSAKAVAMTAQGLRYYGLCFMAYCTHSLLSRACYSLKDTILPMKIGIGTVGLNLILSIILSKFMGLRGVVLATAIADSLASVLLLFVFHRTKISLHLRRFRKPVCRIGFSAVTATAVCALWLHLDPISNGFLFFVSAACLEFGIYAGLMLLCRDELAMEIISVMRTVWKKDR